MVSLAKVSGANVSWRLGGAGVVRQHAGAQ